MISRKCNLKANLTFDYSVAFPSFSLVIFSYPYYTVSDGIRFCPHITIDKFGHITRYIYQHKTLANHFVLLPTVLAFILFFYH